MTFVELEQWYSSAILPKEMRLNRHTVIKDVGKFVKSHFATLKANSGNLTYIEYYVRLVRLKEIIQQSKPQPQP